MVAHRCFTHNGTVGQWSHLRGHSYVFEAQVVVMVSVPGIIPKCWTKLSQIRPMFGLLSLVQVLQSSSIYGYTVHSKSQLYFTD